MILRSWPAVSWLIRYEAAIISTANTTMVYGTRSRTDSLKTAPATSQIVRMRHQPVAAGVARAHLLHEIVFERLAHGLSDTTRAPSARSSAMHAIGLRVRRKLQQPRARADSGVTLRTARRQRRHAVRSATSATTSSHPLSSKARISSSGRTQPAGPAPRSPTRLHSASASDRMCELKNTVQPRARKPRIRSRTSRRPSGSRPDIGSSRNTTSGSFEQRLRQADALHHALRELAQAHAPLAAKADLVEHARHPCRSTSAPRYPNSRAK